MDKKSNVLGKAGAVGFALGVFGFISLLITILTSIVFQQTRFLNPM